MNNDAKVDLLVRIAEANVLLEGIREACIAADVKLAAKRLEIAQTVVTSAKHEVMESMQ